MPNLGILALIVAAGGLLTGPFLALNYAPTLDAAHDSVSYIQNDVTLGWLLRGLHHWSANFAIVLAALHGWRLFWRSAYKRPHHMVWVLGCGVFLVILGFGYTGYLLAGDERAYTGLGVMEAVAGSTPLVGDSVSQALRGGDVVSSAMLTRLYVLHAMILPAVLLGLVIAFVLAMRKAETAAGREMRPWSELVSRDAMAAVGVCGALFLCAWLLQPALGPKPDFGGAGATDARPEWFFLWVNKLLKIVPGATFMIGAVLPGVVVGLAVGLPFLSKGRGRIETVTAVVIVGCIGMLTALSVASDAPPAEPTEAGEPTDAGGAEAQAVALLQAKCTRCHSIAGVEEENIDGPPLRRDVFSQLYTKKFFRLKVKDPVKFWEETSMRYTPKRWKPSDEQIELLVKYFFGDG